MKLSSRMPTAGDDSFTGGGEGRRSPGITIRGAATREYGHAVSDYPLNRLPFHPAPFNPALWQQVAGFEDLTDITYHRHVRDGVAQPTVRVAFNRPRCATHSGRTPSTSSTAPWTTPGCHPTSAWSC